jgi:hypothetical protein
LAEFEASGCQRDESHVHSDGAGGGVHDTPVKAGGGYAPSLPPQENRYGITPYKRSSYKRFPWRILQTDILGRRRSVAFVRESSHKGWNPVSDLSAPRPTPAAYRGVIPGLDNPDAYPRVRHILFEKRCPCYGQASRVEHEFFARCS